MLREDQPKLSDKPDHQSTPENTPVTDRSVAQRSEDIYIRNFDLNQAYNLTIRVSDGDGIVFTNRYHLTPGETVSELGRLPVGEYEVEAELNTRRQQTTRCKIDGTPNRTALVEVGNGTISVTEGLYR